MEFESLTLTEIIRLQNQLSEVLHRRFERSLALAFTDIVGSTPYFARFGNEAGRRLQQMHLDAVQSAISAHDGRVVDTAGDGCFLCFPRAIDAVNALTGVQEQVSQKNLSLPREHQLSIRAGVHHGPVLTDGTLVVGDSVNFCARVAASSEPGEIRLTRECFLELPHAARPRCRALPSVLLKGLPGPVELLRYEWREIGRFPALIRVEETGIVIQLPDRDTISFGRLGEVDGAPGNDVVLALPDKNLVQKISRWHFELRRRVDGFTLRTLSSQSTEVDGQSVAQGQEVAVRIGTVVRVSGVMTLHFCADPRAESAARNDLFTQTTGGEEPTK